MLNGEGTRLVGGDGGQTLQKWDSQTHRKAKTERTTTIRTFQAEPRSLAAATRSEWSH